MSVVEISVDIFLSLLSFIVKVCNKVVPQSSVICDKSRSLLLFLFFHIMSCCVGAESFYITTSLWNHLTATGRGNCFLCFMSMSCHLSRLCSRLHSSHFKAKIESGSVITTFTAETIWKETELNGLIISTVRGEFSSFLMELEDNRGMIHLSVVLSMCEGRHLTTICPSTPTGLLRWGCGLKQGRHHRPDGRRRRHSDGDRHYPCDAEEEAVHLHPPRSHRGEKRLTRVFIC